MQAHKLFQILTLSLSMALTLTSCYSQPHQGSYTVVVEGYDWGAAASKVILHLKDGPSEVYAEDFVVSVKRSSPCLPTNSSQVSGKRKVIYAYISDETGNHAKNGKYITLILEVGPYLNMDSPILYFSNEGCDGNQWVDYKINITNQKTREVWDKEINRIIPLVDQFDLDGQFTFNDDITLTYASFQPEKSNGKVPLIIWLHGGGEGGTDPSIILLANRAANYASPEIQEIFNGAHVLVPQCPTFWMQNADGEHTEGEVNDIYNEPLMALFEHYQKSHPDIDPNRIYIGGCSNGGYMTQKLMLLHPDYFAAGFPSALAYQAEFLSEKDIQTLADQSIWYIHSKDDPVTIAAETVIPTVQRIQEAGAKDVHLSLYDHVIDLYGLYGGDNYHYHGHFSWIYCHRNYCEKVIDGKKISVMEWLASKSR
jgi:predicted esterase